MWSCVFKKRKGVQKKRKCPCSLGVWIVYFYNEFSITIIFHDIEVFFYTSLYIIFIKTKSRNVFRENLSSRLQVNVYILIYHFYIPWRRVFTWSRTRCFQNGWFQKYQQTQFYHNVLWLFSYRKGNFLNEPYIRIQ